MDEASLEVERALDERLEAGIFTLPELLSLTEAEHVQLEEIEGDLALEAAWFRRRRLAQEEEKYGEPRDAEKGER